MAGDWIKMELVTPDKPEIHGMAERLKIPAEQVLGGLCRVWIWADQQSINGNALSVTENALDSISRVSGLAGAMRKEGWIDGPDGHLSLPHFDRHNGKTAKQRALTNKRVETLRKRISNGSSVTHALPEKRREELTTFGLFWTAYPRKQAKQKALSAFQKLSFSNGDFDRLLSALEAAKLGEEWQKEGGKYVPHAATWLNGRRFEDELPKPGTGVASIYRREGAM